MKWSRKKEWLRARGKVLKGMIMMIWIISVPRRIKWRPQGLKCDCSAPNKLHFMPHVEVTTFFFTPFINPLWKKKKKNPQSGPASWDQPQIHLQTGILIQMSSLSFNTATNAGCPIYNSTFVSFHCRKKKYEAFMQCVMKTHYLQQGVQASIWCLSDAFYRNVWRPV